MDPITLALIMGGTGLLKSEVIDRPKEDRQRQLASSTQRYSPWTGLKAGEVNEADPFGNALQGAATGASMGQNMEAAKANQALTTAQTNYFNKMSGGTPNLAMEAPAQEFGTMGYDDYRKANPLGGKKQAWSVLGG